MLSEETAIQQNYVDTLPLLANMPGNAALCEPVDLQSEHLSLNAATFYTEHSIYIYTLKVFKMLLPIILTLIDCKFLDHSSH